MQSIKEHNLKANHNQTRKLLTYDPSVCNLSKNTIWKQITTINVSSVMQLNLYAIYQRTQSESKSQRVAWCGAFVSSVCNLSKNTIWKQITTEGMSFAIDTFLYAIYQRTQSESKSQLWQHLPQTWLFCMQSIKEHNLKANHNGLIEAMV